MLLFRMQRDTLFELLLKTQSVEFLDFASKDTDKNRRLMIVNEKDKFTFVKTINYKEKEKQITYKPSPMKKRQRTKKNKVELPEKNQNNDPNYGDIDDFEEQNEEENVVKTRRSGRSIKKKKIFDNSDKLINPVDSIIASYPYLSLE